MTAALEGVAKRIGAYGKSGKEDSVWKFDPPTLDMFVESDQYLGFSPLSEIQRHDANELLGTDPKKIFDNGSFYNVGVLLWGKGCISGDTILTDAITGESLKVEDWVDKNRSLHMKAFNEKTGKDQIDEVSAPFLKGEAELFEVTLANGQKIKVTDQHKFFTNNGWKKLCELKEGDEIVTEGKVVCQECGKDRVSKIVSIKPLGKGNFYDLTNPVNHNYYAHGILNHNSGKDFFCSILQSYMLQVLRCMRNPQKYFNLAPTEAIDTVNVSLSQDHAIDVYFVKFEAAILANKWLRKYYSIYRGSKLVTLPGNAEGKPRLEILSGKVTFTDYNLRALAYGCDNEAAEGKNIIYFSADEFSAFKSHTQMANVKKIYSTLRTSATSRFGTKWKGMIISYPRSEDDATVKLYDESQISHSTPEGDTIYGSRHMTWEVRPHGSFSEKTFEFEGVQVPIDFRDEFERFPEDSKAKYMCRPPAVESAFITHPERIYGCVVPGKRPLFGVEDVDMRLQMGDAELDEAKTKYYVGKRISWIGDHSFTAMNTPRVIHVDGGLSEDKAALIMAHGEQIEVKVLQPDGTFQSVYMNKVIVDAAITWRPNRKKQLQVSLNSIEALILELSKQFKILRVSYDQWQGQSALETLQAHGIHAEEHTIRDKDYLELRMMIYSNAVELLAPTFNFGDMDMENKDAELLIDELRKLKILNGRVDHLPELSKDLADALAGVNWLLNSIDEKHKVVGRMPRGVLGQAMSFQAASPLSPVQAAIWGT